MLTVTLCASGRWTAHTSHVSPPQQFRTAHYHSQLSDPSSNGRIAPQTAPERQDARRLDRYGNDVSNAVATYTYDRAGTVYEEHSPQTEVPRLKPPVS
jgi:hypothetical protein